MKCPFCEEIIAKPSESEKREGVCEPCQKKIREIDEAPHFTVPVRSDIPPEARTRFFPSGHSNEITTLPIDHKAAKRCK